MLKGEVIRSQDRFTIEISGRRPTHAYPLRDLTVVPAGALDANAVRWWATVRSVWSRWVGDAVH